MSNTLAARRQEVIVEWSEKNTPLSHTPFLLVLFVFYNKTRLLVYLYVCNGFLEFQLGSHPINAARSRGTVRILCNYLHFVGATTYIFVLQLSVFLLYNKHPRANGNTATMVQAFEKGATEAGHEVTAIHVGAKKVAGCLGCQYCFTHEGTCVQKDDMTGIWEVLNQTDLLVFASPIYWWEVTAQTKAVIDRLYAHALVGFNFNKIALLFDSGSPEVYDAPISMFKSICSYLKWENAGTICIPDMENKDSMKGSPMLEEVYKFGRSL